jgi:hypothetical protein
MRSKLSLEDVAGAVTAAWSLDTCDPVDRHEWSPDNPARGQCGVTALVVSDLLGGRLVEARVFLGGEPVEYHYWNELPDGTHVDLTRQQFTRGETFGEEIVLPPRRPDDWMAPAYRLMAERVAATLAPAGADAGLWLRDDS